MADTILEMQRDGEAFRAEGQRFREEMRAERRAFLARLERLPPPEA
jgi:hypothetical protein